MCVLLFFIIGTWFYGFCVVGLSDVPTHPHRSTGTPPLSTPLTHRRRNDKVGGPTPPLLLSRVVLNRGVYRPGVGHYFLPLVPP